MNQFDFNSLVHIVCIQSETVVSIHDKFLYNIALGIIEFHAQMASDVFLRNFHKDSMCEREDFDSRHRLVSGRCYKYVHLEYYFQIKTEIFSKSYSKIKTTYLVFLLSLEWHYRVAHAMYDLRLRAPRNNRRPSDIVYRGSVCLAVPYRFGML